MVDAWAEHAIKPGGDPFCSRAACPAAGLAIYNSHILEFQFPMVLYKKLLGQPVGLEDLAELQPDIYRYTGPQ